MRTRYIHLLLFPIISLISACSGAGSVNDPKGKEKMIDAKFWADLKCDSIDGLAFSVNYYVDNQLQGSDVLRFKQEKMESEASVKQGLSMGVFRCQEAAPGSLIIKSIMTSPAGAYRRWVLTLSQGAVDGTLDTRDTKDAELVTQTFSGQLSE